MGIIFFFKLPVKITAYNLVVKMGKITDFLNFYILGYDFPVFNIADILIVVGVGLMIIDVVRGELHVIKERKRKC